MEWIKRFAEIMLDLPLDYDWNAEYEDDRYVKQRRVRRQARGENRPCPETAALTVYEGKLTKAG